VRWIAIEDLARGAEARDAYVLFEGQEQLERGARIAVRAKMCDRK
jgi:hypothetical protein